MSPPARGSNGAATAGFIIGIVAVLAGFGAGNGLAWLLVVAGGVLSIVGIARASDGAPGRGFAFTGIILSVLALVGCLAHVTAGPASSSIASAPPYPTSTPFYATATPYYEPPSTSTAPPISQRTYTGNGDDVVRLDKPTGIAVVTFSCPRCTSNTIVTGDGSDYGLVNVIGPYTGKRWIDERDNTLTTQLTVRAHGRWTLTISDLSQATRATGPVSGHGDDVVVLNTNSTTARITNRGPSNFIVHTITSRGYVNTPVNEIGGYSGTVPMSGPALVEVQSSGDWTITPQ